jgi:hypothetical protein
MVAITKRLFEDECFIRKIASEYLSYLWNKKNSGITNVEPFIEYLGIRAYRIGEEFDDFDPLGGKAQYKNRISVDREKAIA